MNLSAILNNIPDFTFDKPFSYSPVILYDYQFDSYIFFDVPVKVVYFDNINTYYLTMNGELYYKSLEDDTNTPLKFLTRNVEMIDFNTILKNNNLYEIDEFNTKLIDTDVIAVYGDLIIKKDKYIIGGDTIKFESRIKHFYSDQLSLYLIDENNHIYNHDILSKGKPAYEIPELDIKLMDEIIEIVEYHDLGTIFITKTMTIFFFDYHSNTHVINEGYRYSSSNLRNEIIFISDLGNAYSINHDRVKKLKLLSDSEPTKIDQIDRLKDKHYVHLYENGDLYLNLNGDLILFNNVNDYQIYDQIWQNKFKNKCEHNKYLFFILDSGELYYYANIINYYIDDDLENEIYISHEVRTLHLDKVPQFKEYRFKQIIATGDEVLLLTVDGEVFHKTIELAEYGTLIENGEDESTGNGKDESESEESEEVEIIENFHKLKVHGVNRIEIPDYQVNLILN